MSLRMCDFESEDQVRNACACHLGCDGEETMAFIQRVADCHGRNSRLIQHVLERFVDDAAAVIGPRDAMVDTLLFLMNANLKNEWVYDVIFGWFHKMGISYKTYTRYRLFPRHGKFGYALAFVEWVYTTMPVCAVDWDMLSILTFSPTLNRLALKLLRNKRVMDPRRIQPMLMARCWDVELLRDGLSVMANSGCIMSQELLDRIYVMQYDEEIARCMIQMLRPATYTQLMFLCKLHAHWKDSPRMEEMILQCLTRQLQRNGGGTRRLPLRVYTVLREITTRQPNISLKSI